MARSSKPVWVHDSGMGRCESISDAFPITAWENVMRSGRWEWKTVPGNHEESDSSVKLNGVESGEMPHVMRFYWR